MSIQIILLTFSLMISIIDHAQTVDTAGRFTQRPPLSLFKTYRKTEILTGVSFQSSDFNGSTATRRYLEMGFARSIHSYSRHGPASYGVYISEEVYLSNKNIYGTKLGAYTHYLFDIGLALIYYTDFNKGNLKLRPELGLGIGHIRIVGGYNVPTINNKAFPELIKSNGQLTIQVLIPVKKRIIADDGISFKQLFLKSIPQHTQ